MTREQLHYDVLIVGAGPAGLAAACRLKQLANEQKQDVTVCVLEKGSEVGAHILSGALMQTTAMDELFPDWKLMGAPIEVPVSEDRIFYLTDSNGAVQFPTLLEPRPLKNSGNYVISLGNVCRWLALQAESMGVEIYAGFPAAELMIDEKNQVQGVITADAGIDRHGNKKPSFQPGIEIHASYTLFCEGCRGHLGKQLIAHYQLDRGKEPQHYGLGIKELWEIDESQHQPGLVMHTAGWPMTESNSSGGGFLYHVDNNQVSLGFITELSYSNPYVNPFEEMQRWKLHPQIKTFLEGGKRIAYGARAITKGGLQSLPKMTFPGGLLLGCDAGTLVNAKIKGSHTAMKSGMLAAESVIEALNSNGGREDLVEFAERFKESWIFKELHEQRNWGPAISRWGTLPGSVFNFIDTTLLRGKTPFTLSAPEPDFSKMKLAKDCKIIEYPKPDNKITFNRLDSVFLSNTNHEEEQPCHLNLQDDSIPIQQNLNHFDEPAQRYCPAGVYEVVTTESGPSFQINAQNCLHCKTCDIKDPSQNITWITPEGCGGPNYPNM